MKVRAYCIILSALLFSAGSLSGQNLVKNGYAEEGDNSNFSVLTFDPTDFAVGSGSFVSTTSRTVFADELVVYEAGSEYHFDFWAKVETYVPGNKMYAFVSCHDIDGHVIDAPTFMFVAGSTTTLSSPLNPSDTYIHVANLSGFEDSALHYRKALSIWAWKNSLGHEYPPESYTRYVTRGYSGGLWDQGVGLEYGLNRIKLKAPWAGASFPVGTPLSQGNSGATYPYTKESFELSSQWQKFETVFSSDMIRPGTAFLRIGWLMDYPSKGVTTKVCGVSLRPTLAPGVYQANGNVGVGVPQPNQKLEVNGTIRAKEVIVETANFPDYVFEEGYELRSLDSLQRFIAQNGRLPGLPSAESAHDEGIPLGELQRSLVEKIEELTLYTLQLHHESAAKQGRIESLSQENEELKLRLLRIESLLEDFE